MSNIDVTVKKDRDLMRFVYRIERRNREYGNWRQTYIDCLGMCQFPLGDGVICGDTEDLEFHEIYLDGCVGKGYVTQVVLLCNYHHWSIHGEKWVNKRGYPSMLQYDIALEMAISGGYQNWLEKFNLKERRVKYDLEVDTRSDKTDLDSSKNS